jgi:hypothetical protein
MGADILYFYSELSYFVLVPLDLLLQRPLQTFFSIVHFRKNKDFTNNKMEQEHPSVGMMRPAQPSALGVPSTPIGTPPEEIFHPYERENDPGYITLQEYYEDYANED